MQGGIPGQGRGPRTRCSHAARRLSAHMGSGSQMSPWRGRCLGLGLSIPRALDGLWGPASGPRFSSRCCDPLHMPQALWPQCPPCHTTGCTAWSLMAVARGDDDWAGPLAALFTPPRTPYMTRATSPLIPMTKASLVLKSKPKNSA